MSCQYVWKTTTKKGQICGRKLKNSSESYCYQHKPIIKNEQNSEIAPKIPTIMETKTTNKKMPVNELTNTPAKINKTVKYISVSSSSSLSSSSSSSTDSSSD